MGYHADIPKILRIALVSEARYKFPQRRSSVRDIPRKTLLFLLSTVRASPLIFCWLFVGLPVSGQYSQAILEAYLSFIALATSWYLLNLLVNARFLGVQRPASGWPQRLYPYLLLAALLLPAIGFLDVLRPKLGSAGFALAAITLSALPLGYYLRRTKFAHYGVFPALVYFSGLGWLSFYIATLSWHPEHLLLASSLGAMLAADPKHSSTAARPSDPKVLQGITSLLILYSPTSLAALVYANRLEPGFLAAYAVIGVAYHLGLLGKSASAAYSHPAASLKLCFLQLLYIVIVSILVILSP
ncbi:MAG: hypothetical protein DCC75_12740 [Proteobacteria bacterium]|nr:MAG: hypothetical protein DCC75_12740 [Pseudomonadota bacterium]